MTCSRNMWLFLVAAVLVLRGPLVTSAAQSPCPNVFQYVGSPGSEHGVIILPNPYPNLAIDISVSLYVTAQVPSNGPTILKPVDDAMWQKLAAGSRDPVFYRLDFPVSSPLPTIKTITVNNNVICTGSRPSASYVTSLTVQHTVYNGRCNSTSLDCPFNIQKSTDLRPKPPPDISYQIVPSSPCPGVFEYKVESSGDWYGIISVPNPFPLVAIDIRVELYVAAYATTRSGRLRLLNDLSDEWNRMKTGEQYTVQYKLDIPARSPLPTIKSIVVNNQQICTGSKPNSHEATIFSYQHGIFCRECTSASPDCPCNVVRYKAPPQKPSPPAQPPVPRPGAGTNIRCGITDVISNALVLNGKDAIPGEWPWHAALYLHQGTNTVYRCGGSVIGTRIIITAAHCVTHGNGKARDPEGFVVALGRYDLTKRKEEGSQQKDVQEVLPHPAYNHRTYDADIALLILESIVEYSGFVRPVCLWSPSDTSLESVVGKKGVVVGWGRDEDGSLSHTLKVVVTPIVSRDTCRNLHQEFYLKFVHANTFCAGFANGSTPCNGDSGGGMVMPVGEQGDSKLWELRGIVSNTRPDDRIKDICDPNSYIVFTDVAKYLDWINTNSKKFL